MGFSSLFHYIYVSTLAWGPFSNRTDMSKDWCVTWRVCESMFISKDKLHHLYGGVCVGGGNGCCHCHRGLKKIIASCLLPSLISTMLNRWKKLDLKSVSLQVKMSVCCMLYVTPILRFILVFTISNKTTKSANHTNLNEIFYKDSFET